MKTLLAVLLLAGSDAAAQVPKDDPKPTTAEKLVGVWTLVASSDKLPAGAEVTVEFTADGTLVLRVSVGKAVNSVSRGTFKAEAEKIHYSIDGGGGPRKETLTVKSLTADTLVLVDPEKKREEFRRAVVKK